MQKNVKFITIILILKIFNIYSIEIFLGENSELQEKTIMPGLTKREAEKRLKSYGLNKLKKKKKIHFSSY